jgi:hypothetical protein
LKEIRQKWFELSSTLKKVLTEETQQYDDDVKAWQMFAENYEKQNFDSQKLIDSQLGLVTKKLVVIRSESEAFVSKKEIDTQKIGEKIAKLKGKKETALVELENKLQQNFKRVGKVLITK